MKVVTGEMMGRWESETIRDGVSVASLMEDAVEGCLRVLLLKFRHPRNAVVLCGKGNNGNDGVALAKRLEDFGWKVEVVLSHDLSERVPHPLGYVNSVLTKAVVWPDLPQGRLHPAAPRVVIDALLGLGSRGAPEGAVREMIEWARGEKGVRDFYVSLDVPSGMDVDTGEVVDVAFPADLTLGIGGVKVGCVRDVAGGVTGQVRGVVVRVRDEDVAGEALGDFVTLDAAGMMTRPLDAGTHKYKQGVVGIWAGSVGMTGAALLAARAAVRSGAGLVKLFTVREGVEAAAATTPEIMARVVESNEVLSDEFLECDALVMGPGLGRSEEVGWIFERTLGRVKKPVVLDADALYFISQKPEILNNLDVPFVLTPHVGEMSRLVGGATGERSVVAVDWVKRYGGVLVLKGANTVVADGDGVSWNGSGNAGMASGGMGDVLSGVIGGLLAQGYPVSRAARLGVFWHGHSADRVAFAGAPVSLMASDVVEYLGLAWQDIRCEV